MNRVPMTAAGLERLRQELNQLKFEARPAIVKAIAEARALGDLRENAEYHAAKERQSFIEGRINELESKISLADVIDVTKLPQDGRVVFGVTVELIDTNSDKKTSYQLVGDDEADIKASKISISSPIARALIGKSEGDVVQVQTLRGLSSLRSPTSSTSRFLMARSKSSARWLREHFSDPFVRKAQKEGFRSRAAYKLKEIQKKIALFDQACAFLSLGPPLGGGLRSWLKFWLVAAG